MVIACVGGGSNAIGAFAEFISDKEVKLVGVEAAGRKYCIYLGRINTLSDMASKDIWQDNPFA